jgi:hypothetical protein
MKRPGAAQTAPAVTDPYSRGVDMAQDTCSIGGCESPVRARGWCWVHYQRWYKHGDPTINLRDRGPQPRGTCVIDGCNEPVLVIKRGWCNTHYCRWQRNGDPLIVRRPPVTPETVAARFAKYISDPDPRTGCVEWGGSRSGDGYGVFSLSGETGRKMVRASHVAYIQRYGPVPDGMQVLHRCDNPPCVNPDHLFLGTQQDNMTDKMVKGRHVARQGEERTDAKLTWAAVDDMRRRYRGRGKGPTVAVLASEYGVSVATAYNAIHGKTWRGKPEVAG